MVLHETQNFKGLHNPIASKIFSKLQPFIPLLSFGLTKETWWECGDLHQGKVCILTVFGKSKNLEIWALHMGMSIDTVKY